MCVNVCKHTRHATMSVEPHSYYRSFYRSVKNEHFWEGHLTCQKTRWSGVGMFLFVERRHKYFDYHEVKRFLISHGHTVLPRIDAAAIIYFVVQCGVVTIRGRRLLLWAV